jgi:predicted RNA-binding Zn-ribbon protein involved in translation (DUF1610 family)
VNLFKPKEKEKEQSSPKFFCDNCGTEVGQEATECPKCGRQFSSVRCPACGFVGEVKLFDNGCPTCGYAPTPDEQFRQGAPKNGASKEGASKDGASHPPRSAPASALPLWVYIVAGVAFAGALYILFLTMTR